MVKQHAIVQYAGKLSTKDAQVLSKKIQDNRKRIRKKHIRNLVSCAHKDN